MLTDILGIRVGHATDTQNLTGCTIALFDEPVVVGVDVRGANSSTIYTDMLAYDNLWPTVSGIMLTGGSSYGLESALGAMRYLEEQGLGVDLGVTKLPIVPAAVIFDLAIGNPHVRPDLAMGRESCVNAKAGPFARGKVGVGTGATIGKLSGVEFASPGGLGTYTVNLYNGIKVSAMVAVNSFGDVIDPTSNKILAGTKNEAGEFINTYEQMKRGITSQSMFHQLNTTIGIVSCNCQLSKVEANRMAKLAHNGLAQVIRPIHTNVDGDTLFATGLVKSSLRATIDLLGTAAADAVAGAVLDAVRNSKRSITS